MRNLAGVYSDPVSSLHKSGKTDGASTPPHPRVALVSPFYQDSRLRTASGYRRMRTTMGAARAGRWNGQRRDGQCFVDYGRAPLRGREFPQRLAFVAASASRWMDEC